MRVKKKPLDGNRVQVSLTKKEEDGLEAFRIREMKKAGVYISMSSIVRRLATLGSKKLQLNIDWA